MYISNNLDVMAIIKGRVTKRRHGIMHVMTMSDMGEASKMRRDAEP